MYIYLYMYVYLYMYITYVCVYMYICLDICRYIYINMRMGARRSDAAEPGRAPQWFHGDIGGVRGAVGA